MIGIKVSGLGATVQSYFGRAMEKDCTLKVERPVYEQEELHRTCGYSKPRSTGKYKTLAITPAPRNKEHFNPSSHLSLKQ
jgi:hypothetical protein